MIDSYKNLIQDRQNAISKKDRFTSADKYLESVAATCLHMHKELIHDNLVKISTGELSEEEGNKFFFTSKCILTNLSTSF